MKYYSAFVAFFFYIFFATAQNQPQTASVEKSVFGVQTGFLGIWAHNETKLSNSIALRSEIGFDAVFSGVDGGELSGTNHGNTDVKYLFAPVLTLEPRWYYNLQKRFSKGKPMDKNNGNFIALKIVFHPDLFLISNAENVSVPNQISFIPKWGIRRVIEDHFTVEAGIGLGYHHIFDDDYFRFEDDDETIALDLHLRIGYTF